MTNVLILGAGVQVAWHVIDRLLQNNSIHLTLYLRNASRLQHLADGQIKLIEGDMLDIDSFFLWVHSFKHSLYFSWCCFR